MKRKIVSTISKGIVLTALAGMLSLAITETADARHRRGPGVVRHRAHRTVRVEPVRRVVHYVPRLHAGCRVKSGYYYDPVFGYHRHHRHPGGIYFGVNLAF